MKRYLVPFLAALLLGTGVRAAVKVVSPTVEYRSCPVVIGVDSPVFGWRLEGGKKTMQSSYRIVVSSSEANLKAGVYDIWDSGLVASTESVAVPYGGAPLKSRANVWWKVFVTAGRSRAVSAPQSFHVALLDQRDWQAKWIGGECPEDVLTGHVKIPARYLRKVFRLSDVPASAYLYISGLGSCEVSVNGTRLAPGEILAPTVSDYDKTVYYNTYEVAPLLKKGENTLSVVLEGGRFTSMRIGVEKTDAIPDIRHYGLPRMIAQLEITYKDGKPVIIGSGEDWKIAFDGPIRYSSEFDGEFYDARRSPSVWKDAVRVEAPKGVLTAQPNPNIAIQHRLLPKAVFSKDGRAVIDMGENMVGRLRIKAKGNPGDTLVFRYAETLNPDSTLYTANLRKAEVTDYYIIKDANPFTWAPSFTYHGFRYAEISGLSYLPQAKDIEGQCFYDRMTVRGYFRTSNETINKIYANACRGIRGNYRGMPTDCPQRDERMGWLGDRAQGVYGEAYIFDNHLLYSKWVRDIEEAQLASGSLPDVAPLFWNIRSDNMTWPAAFVTASDMIYNQYGDIRAIRDHYPAMKRWLVYMKERYGRNGLITKDTYGDWCMPPESPELIHSKDPSRITPGPVLSTAFYYRLCKLMEKYAVLVSDASDERYFAVEAGAAAEAFNREYLNEDGSYANNTVTANLLPLWFGMVPAGREKAVFKHIVDKTNDEFGGHVSVGVVGIMQLMRALTEFGRLDMAYKLATLTDYPSWGYMAENGATTIWELWNGNTAAPEMNSGNHVMILGDLLVWYYEYLGGIKALKPGFKEIRLKPYVPAGLDWVTCSYYSVYGQIKSEWKVKDGKFVWTFTIPANTTAKVWLPGDLSPTDYGSGTYTLKTTL